MSYTDILKYALILGEQKNIYDKINRIVYIPSIDTNGKWFGILMVYDDDYSEFYDFNYGNKPKQDEITQNLIDFVINYIEANDDAEYEIR